jgi:hypothetical protein
MEALAEELNKLFMTELATEISVARDVDPEESSKDETLRGKRFILVGASHLSRLAYALEDQEGTVVDLSVPGWRATPDVVENMVTQLKSVLHEEYNGETVIIYQLFDNSCYMSCDEEGNRCLPIKGRDNVYHVPGRLVFASRDDFRGLFTTVLPLLRAGLDNTKVLLSPMMRYIVQKCCEDDSHIINKGLSNYGTNMGTALGKMGEWLKDLAFTRRVRNFTVMCPNEILGDEGSIKAGTRRVTAFWKDGPVHLTQEGYSALGTGMLDRLATSNLARRVDTDKQVMSYVTKERMIDRSVKRQNWITSNDSSVRRRYEAEEERPQWPPRGRGRGGRRWRPQISQRPRPL